MVSAARQFYSETRTRVLPLDKRPHNERGPRKRHTLFMSEPLARDLARRYCDKNIAHATRCLLSIKHKLLRVKIQLLLQNAKCLSRRLWLHYFDHGRCLF
jgi:hypothetical protein